MDAALAPADEDQLTLELGTVGESGETVPAGQIARLAQTFAQMRDLPLQSVP